MNFISTFDELNKLYEEATPEVEKEEVVEEGCDKKLNEAAEDEVVDVEIPVEEVPAEEPVVEDEPRQLICECDKCGALVIKAEADIIVDEDSDLVNIEDECQFCEEAKGYKIVGVVAPYEITEEAPTEEEAPVEEEAPIDESLEAKDQELEELFDANIKADLKNFGGTGNKVSVLNPRLESVGSKNSTEADEDDLDELFNANIKVDARGFGGSGNDVSVL